jgi:hypothetical protein
MDDRALETARDILEGNVCECGDTEGSHIIGGQEHGVIKPDSCVGDDGDGCDCTEFRPVQFVVIRA